MTRSISSPGFWLSLMLLCCSLAPLRAEQFGSFTYRVVAGNTVEIARYPLNAVGVVNIPETIGGRPVTSIGYNAFFLCTGLTSITIPSSVIKIGPSAFNNCSGLTTLTLPTGITTISDSMFMNCTALTGLTLPANVTTIGFSAFFGCHRLASMVLPDSVTTIGDKAFTSCLGLTSITLSSSLTSIGSDAFNSCRALIEITIPSSVTLIGSFAFKNCVSLTSILVELGSAHFSSAGGALFNAGQTALIACAGGKAGAFTLPSSVDRVVDGAFFGCINLESILVEPGNANFTTIGGALFNAEQTAIAAYPAGLAGTYLLPAGVTTIERYAFSYCKGLTSLALPDTLTIIKDHAFEFCISLTGLILPEGITFIGSDAFRYCTKLSTATFLGNAPTLTGSAFSSTKPGFTIYYLSSRTGFTSPTWNGYPAIMIDEATAPAASWLLEYGLSYNTDLQDDRNGDGVTLLMAYALNLDPRLNLQDSLPQPAVGVDTLQLSFHATSKGITYRVQTCTDLQSWTTEGVTLSPPGIDHKVTASVPRDTVKRYLRLIVED